MGGSRKGVACSRSDSIFLEGLRSNRHRGFCKTGFSFFPSPGQLQAPVGRELVLDYIIERKRIDDLCGSIIDGRFREQKVGEGSGWGGGGAPLWLPLLERSCSVPLQFRLKRCGLSKPIYLVELHGSAASHLSLPETTLQQAIVNTQVRPSCWRLFYIAIPQHAAR